MKAQPAVPGSHGHRPATALLVLGTRPEAIKLAPVVRALREGLDVQPVVITTGQHQVGVDDVLELFGIVPQRSLRMPRRSPDGLVRLYADMMAHLDPVMSVLDPDVVVVQGDTASVLAGAQTAFLQRRPVVHVEAGLRSGSLSEPFPEEANRRLVSTISSLHLAPTLTAEANLLHEGHSGDEVIVTGNTAVDALLFAAAAPAPLPDPRFESALAGGRRLVVVTAHRRESWGAGMRRIASGVATLAEAHPEVLFAIVTHMNPAVRQVFGTAMAGRANVFVTGPLRYVQFVRLLAAAEVVLTDSGGIQEEAPVLGVPVLVLRDRTERTEGVYAGAAELVGTDPGALVAATHRVLASRRERSPVSASSLYGDGRAGVRSAAAIGWLLGLCPRPEPFDAGPLIPTPASATTY
ncbi:MAG: non-hydrolyzing UDP-N-acetylglucosamine 2-epimerase [Acidimicrobiales bacterium]